METITLVVKTSKEFVMYDYVRWMRAIDPWSTPNIGYIGKTESKKSFCMVVTRVENDKWNREQFIKDITTTRQEHETVTLIIGKAETFE